MSIRPFGALEGHPQLGLGRVGTGVQLVVLTPDRVIENLAEDAPHKCRIQPESLAHRRTVLQQRRFAIGVTHRAVAAGLHPRDVARQARSLTERRHQHRINVIQTLPKRR